MAERPTVNVTCPYCGKPAAKATGRDVYPGYQKLWEKRFWRCVPCNAYVGCHGKSDQPLGTLANAELRMARRAAHATFDSLWRSGELSRTEAYAWLAEKLGIPPKETHIGMFDLGLCRQVLEVCRA